MRKDKGDSYLGVDCLFIAVLNEKDVASALADAGVGKLQIETALLDLRGKDQSKKASPYSCMHTLPLRHLPQPYTSLQLMSLTFQPPRAPDMICCVVEPCLSSCNPGAS